MEKTFDGALIAQVVSAIALTVTAIFALLAIWTQRKQTRSTILLECLRAYVATQQMRADALRQNSPELCRDYYRALFDLHWSEFQMWRDKQIDDHVMEAWLAARRRNYTIDHSLQVNSVGDAKETVRYKEEWKRLSGEYFEPSDPFVRFTNEVHGSIAVKELMKR